jgi:hypothetical protein
VVFEDGDADEASRAVTGWSGLQPGDQDVVDCAAVVRAELFQVGAAAVAMDDCPGHAVWRRRLSQYARSDASSRGTGTAPSATAFVRFSTAARTWSCPSVAIHASSAGVEVDSEEVTTKPAYR